MTPFVLGIGGGSASGKTTVARRLVAALGDKALLIHHDRYYHSLPEALRGDPLAHNFDHPDALDTERLIADLDLLRSGEEARLPVYDFARHRRAGREDRVAPRPVIVVEGILVLADPRLRARFDRAVYVDVPADIRLMRRVLRDLDERGREVHEVLARYAQTVRPMHQRFVEPSRAHADRVLDGTADPDGLVGEVLMLIPPPLRL